MISDRLSKGKEIFLILIAASTIIISYLHYSTLPVIHDLHNIFAELYYIPLMIGALVFGMRGAVATFIFVSVLYIPHVIINWTASFSFVANKLLHALISGLFALLAGYLVDREKKLRVQSEKDRYLSGLGQAAAAIVHDLKNPLISIIGFARRIREGKGNIVTASDTIIKSAEDMQLIARDVLDFARPQRMELSKADMNEVISTACEYCRMKADEKGVDVSASLPDGPVTVSIDRPHMQRALINLISNAIEASHRAGAVTVRVEAEDDIPIIRIRDCGEGMDRETLENVFIPFYTRKSSGTGLGMAIARKIIEGHQGDIRIESRQGTGTEVIIKLPQKRGVNNTEGPGRAKN